MMARALGALALTIGISSLLGCFAFAITYAFTGAPGVAHPLELGGALFFGGYLFALVGVLLCPYSKDGPE